MFSAILLVTIIRLVKSENVDSEVTTASSTCSLGPKDDGSLKNIVNCTITQIECSTWTVPVFIGLKPNQTSSAVHQKVEAIRNYLYNNTAGCAGSSSMLLMTPYLSYQDYCSPELFSQWAVDNMFDNLQADMTEFETDELDREILGMFEAFTQCDSYKNKGNEAGMVLFFTDIDCADICTSQMVQNQQKLIDSLTANGYNIRFIRLGADQTENDCFKEIFPRCGVYGDIICSMNAYNSVEAALRDQNQRFCPALLDLDTVPTGGASVFICCSIVSTILAYFL